MMFGYVLGLSFCLYTLINVKTYSRVLY